MCGIAGILDLNGAGVEPEALHRMIAMLVHRGPDEHGVHTGGHWGIAHARLSIIDLKTGQQPMSTEDGNLWITFSGEIFNYCELRNDLLKRGHRFRTCSDTEVILHLYQEEGEACVDKLNGQWAFAIWDLRLQKLFLSRDRLGVRPLFYTLTDQRFIFASEVKAIFACSEISRELDLQALDQICTFWITLPPRTIFKQIFELPAAHSLTVRNGNIGIRQYWRLEYPSEAELRPEPSSQKAEELLELMLHAVRLRLRADVPIGTYLSGGIDSTLVSAITSHMLGGELKTFSLGFEDPEFDEGVYQRQATDFLKTEHQRLCCSDKKIAEVFLQVIWHTEQPILRTAPAPLYLLAKVVRESGLKVILTGEGSDEILGGYDIFKEAKIRRFCCRQPNSRIRPLLLKRLYPYMKNIHNQGQSSLESFFRRKGENSADPFFSHLPRWELTSTLKMFFSDAVKSELAGYDPYADLRAQLPHSYSKWHNFCQAQYLETRYLLPGYILSSQGDRMSAAHSIETRHPFLDYRVVEFAAKLHPSLKMRALNEKYLLKRVAKSFMPEAIIKRIKQPYRAPEGKSFLTTAASPDFEGVLSPQQIEGDGIFDAAAVALLVSKFKKGRAIGTRDNMALTGILSTQILLDHFVTRKGLAYAPKN